MIENRAVECPLPGVVIWRNRIAREEEEHWLGDIASILERAPPYRGCMRNGTPLINRMSNCGSLGWHADRRGYAYVDAHPLTHEPWPAMPQRARELAATCAAEIGIADFVPDACLINLYEKSGRMNLHRDLDEANFAWPILSVSLGSPCLFALGGLARKDDVLRIRLNARDVLAFYGPSRLRFHGVARILSQTRFANPIFDGLSRINLTLRRAR